MKKTNEIKKIKKITILGATGSIGRNALKVVEEKKNQFELTGPRIIIGQPLSRRNFKKLFNSPLFTKILVCSPCLLR